MWQKNQISKSKTDLMINLLTTKVKIFGQLQYLFLV